MTLTESCAVRVRTRGLVLSLVLLGMGPFLVGKAHARIVTAMSLEWATDMSRWIGVYRIQEVETTAARGRWCDLTLRRVDMLIGQPPDTLRRHEYFFKEYPFPGDSLLVFDVRHMGEPMTIVLTTPKKWPFDPAIDREFRVHESARSILTLVEDRLEETREVRDRPGWHDPGLVVPVPGSSEAYPQLWAGSTVFLVVPPDSLERAKLLASLDGDDWTSMRVACSLGWCYPDDSLDEILYRRIPPESRFTWYQGSAGTPNAVDTLNVPARAIVARSLEEARGRAASESYYPMAEGPDPCSHTHMRRPD